MAEKDFISVVDDWLYMEIERFVSFQLTEGGKEVDAGKTRSERSAFTQFIYVLFMQRLGST